MESQDNVKYMVFLITNYRVKAKTMKLIWCNLIAVSNAKALKCNPCECLRC